MARIECRRCGHRFDSSETAARVKLHRNAIVRTAPTATLGAATSAVFCPKCGKRVCLHGMTTSTAG